VSHLRLVSFIVKTTTVSVSLPFPGFPGGSDYILSRHPHERVSPDRITGKKAQGDTHPPPFSL
jgi:hypothetical protein